MQSSGTAHSTSTTSSRRERQRDRPSRLQTTSSHNVGATSPAHHASPHGTRQACLICLEAVPRSFSEQRPTAQCTHVATICGPCLGKHISHAVLVEGSTAITCPDPECRRIMSYPDVLRGAKNNRACLDRYKLLTLRWTLHREPKFVWCKNPACGLGQLHENGAAAPMIICRACGARSCFVHGVAWHSGLTCDQYTAKTQREDQANRAYIERNTKGCPNPQCGRRIEKSEGCDHMTCRRPAGCGHEFCWICLAEYQTILQEGNHRHRPSCRHYAPVHLYGTTRQTQRQPAVVAPPTPPTQLAHSAPPIRVENTHPALARNTHLVYPANPYTPLLAPEPVRPAQVQSRLRRVTLKLLEALFLPCLRVVAFCFGMAALWASVWFTLFLLEHPRNPWAWLILLLIVALPKE